LVSEHSSALKLENLGVIQKEQFRLKKAYFAEKGIGYLSEFKQKLRSFQSRESWMLRRLDPRVDIASIGLFFYN
jgi:hypothetical protein